MKLIFKKWDTDFFKKKIGLLIIEEKDKNIKKKMMLNNLNKILRKAKQEKYKYILTKVPNKLSSVVDSLESLNFYLRDILLIFSRIGKGRDNKTKFIKEIYRNELKKVTQWAKCIFRNSFFYSDPFFNKKVIDEMHRHWIVNLFNKPKTCFLTYRREKEILGFLIGEKKKRIWNVVLFGVSPDFRRKNIATLLLSRVIKMVPKNTLIMVPTQLKNISAIRCYLKCGFEFSDSLLTFSKTL